MKRIGTHNSATGEASATWVDKLLVPFARCQSKTLEEQYEAGCRYFDIRYKWSEKRGQYVCGHGLWTSKKTLRDVLLWLNEKGDCYAMLTCESGAPLAKQAVTNMIHNYQDVAFTSFNRKKPKWQCYYMNMKIGHKVGYKVLDFRSWHSLLPIPWLWKKKVAFDNVFTFVDFL